MPGKFVMKKSGKGFHWNSAPSNGKVMATSEHYKTRRAAWPVIASVEKNAPRASTVDAEDQVAIKKTANPTRKATAQKTPTN